MTIKIAILRGVFYILKDFLHLLLCAFPPELLTTRVAVLIVRVISLDFMICRPNRTELYLNLMQEAVRPSNYRRGSTFSTSVQLQVSFLSATGTTFQVLTYAPGCGFLGFILSLTTISVIIREVSVRDNIAVKVSNSQVLIRTNTQ